MNFTQLEFVIFLFAVIAMTWSLRHRVARNAFLLVASYYFYAYWDVRFCGLLLLSTLVDYFVAHRIAAATLSSSRRRWLACSLIVNLGMLAAFKYFNFFLDSVRPLVEAFGFHAGSLSILLPVGISFFTFQTLSYTIDVYRRKLQPTNSLLNFALYVAFFPQLVAGPIVRAANLLPQLVTLPDWNRRRAYSGFQQLLRGAVKKVLIADHLAELVDVVFAGPDLYSGVTVWLAVIAYTGQIYYDFSGYSDMAIGIAKLLGYRFPVNFRHPYLATSMADFWHRWHITLSTWLRDYLYIPLGGSRGTTRQTHRNLMVTMTLGGLWHGAAMTFVAWGMWHGAALVVGRSLPRSLGRFAGWLVTISVVLVGWVCFRSATFADAILIYQRMATLPDGIDWYPPLPLLAIACMIVEHIAWTTPARASMRLPAMRWYSPVGTAIMIWALVLYAPQGFRPFVYFQF